MRSAVAAAVLAIVPILGLTQSSASSSESGPVVVSTPDGKLRGEAGDGIRRFEGIRYAAPPGRWERPETAIPWKGVRTATEPGSSCVQKAVFWRPNDAASTTEDCLFLNVYAPKDVPANAPVLVFFHGGGAINGAATDVQPTRLPRTTGSIVVTVNYRLGVLGGLELEQLDAESPDGRSGGNYGNLDKVEALRWVKRNIASFGGDADRVTVAGQSAGAGAVCWLLASPSATDLFSAAIVQSAGACGNASTRTAASAAGLRFADAAGCTDSATVLECLRGKSAAELLDAQVATGTGAGFVSGGSDLPMAPKDAFATGRFNQVPVIFGNVRNEARAFVYEGNDLIRQPLTATAYETQIRDTYGAQADNILAAYPVAKFESPGVARAQVQTDERVCKALPFSRSISKYAPTWTYEFRDETAPLRPYMTVPASFQIGSGHTSDVPYVWESETTTPLNRTQLRLASVMTSMWNELATDGDPNGEGQPTWPRSIAATGEQRLLFGEGGRTTVIAGTSFEAEHRCSVWNV